jgi:YqxM protein
MKNKVTNFVLHILHKKIQPLFRTNEGGSTIRKKRMEKFKKKNKMIIIAAQLVSVWYLLIITGSYLTTNTGAYFNDVEVIENSLHAKWDEEYPPDDGIWERSSLKEVTQGGTCEKGIYARFKNTGESVGHELTKYEIYWIESGNPKKDGVVVKTGTFPIPNHGETYDISYKPTKNGVYQFKAYHETGHNFDSESEKGPWSDQINVSDCSVVPEDDGEGEKDTKPEPPVTEFLGEVSDISWEIGNGESGKVTVKWENPDSPDNFSHVRLYIDGEPTPFKDNITNSQYEFSKKEAETAKKYRITTVDKSGKESVGVKLTVSNEQVIDHSKE